MRLSTKEAYCHAFKKDKAWWCRREGEKQKDGRKTDKIGRVICWRIGWCSGVCKALGVKKKQLCCFLKSIDGGCTWARGRKKGKEEAHGGLTKEISFDIHVVVDFRHAAWLFGWLEGYSKAKGHDVRKNGGFGSGVGGIAGNCYSRLLFEKDWINDPEVRRRLDIDSCSV